MKRAGCAVLVLCLAALAGCGTNKGSEIGPPPPGLLCDVALAQSCGGCNPYAERYWITTQTMDRNVVLEVNRCLDAEADAGYKDTKLVEGAFKACIRKNKKLDEDIKKKILDSTDDFSISDAEYDAFIECRKRLMSQPPVATLLDSHLEGVVYCADSVPKGKSNADDIAELLDGLEVDGRSLAVIPFSTHLEWQHHEQLQKLKPELIVIHASAFYEETKEMQANEQLMYFLDYFADSNIPVLVYTRGLPEESPQDLRFRFERVVAKVEGTMNAKLFVMPKGVNGDSCFKDPTVGAPFKKEVLVTLRQNA